MQFHGNPIPSDEDKAIAVGQLARRGSSSSTATCRRSGSWTGAPDPEAAEARRRRLGSSASRLGRAQARRHRARTEDRGRLRPPPALPQQEQWVRDAVLAASCTRCCAGAARAALQTRRLRRGAEHGFRGGVGARAVRSSRRVGRALRPVPRDAIRTLENQPTIRPQVPPRRHYDQGARRLVNEQALLGIADDELIVGWRDSEWTGPRRCSRRTSPSRRSRAESATHAPCLSAPVGGRGALAFDREPEGVRLRALVELHLLEWAHTDRAALALRGGRRNSGSRR